MIDLRLECNDRGLERVVAGKANGKAEQAALKGRIRGTEDHGFPFKQVAVAHWSRCTICRRIPQNIRILTF